MADISFVQEAFQPPPGHQDTPEQAQLRECLTAILDGHDPITTIQICRGIIDLMRDQLMGSAATVRRHAARAARDDEGLQLMDIVVRTGLTRATVNRLLTESHAPDAHYARKATRETTTATQEKDETGQ